MLEEGVGLVGDGDDVVAAQDCGERAQLGLRVGRTCGPARRGRPREGGPNVMTKWCDAGPFLNLCIWRLAGPNNETKNDEEGR